MLDKKKFYINGNWVSPEKIITTNLWSSELSKLVAEFSGFKGIIEWDKTKPDGTPRKKLDITRIEKIGWSPKVSLEQGIKKTILQYKEEVLKD